MRNFVLLLISLTGCLLIIAPANSLAITGHTVSTNKHRNPFVRSNVNSSKSTTDSMLKSHVIVLKYAKADILAKWINQQHGLLSKQGSLIADARSNRLWVLDDAHAFKLVRQFIHAVDIPVKQVLIKARIIQIDQSYVRSLGVIFNTQSNGSSSKEDLDMDLPGISADTNKITIPIVKLANRQLLNLQLSALEQIGHANIIASPKIMTSNHKTADIESGTEVPYQEKTGEGNTSVTFKKAVLRLRVTPNILPQQRVLLKLTINQDQLTGLTFHGAPAIHTQQLITQVLLHNNETAVLGGIYENILSQEEQGIPVLDKIPGLGLLFKQRRRKYERRELLIFVTPQIIRDDTEKNLHAPAETKDP